MKQTCKDMQEIHREISGVLLFFIYLFVYFWLRWVFGAAHRLPLLVASGGHSLLWCAGFSLRRPLLLQSTGSRHTGLSRCGLRALERRLSSCGARAQLLRGMWDLPRPGLEPMSPALAGGFLTTAPPGKPEFLKSLESNMFSFFNKILQVHFLPLSIKISLIYSRV